MWRKTMCVVAMALAAPAFASSVVVDRGLPDINLNKTDANRSNVSWATVAQNNTPDFLGDDFIFGTAGQKYRVDQIVVWGVQGYYSDTGFQLSDEVGLLELFGAKEGQTLTKLAGGTVTGNTNSDPNTTHMQVSYPDGTGYYESGDKFQIWQTTFSNLNWNVDGNVKYQFGLHDESSAGGYRWFNHASNAALSGTPQEGADNQYIQFKYNSGTASFTQYWDSATDGSWDKSSDINVRVYATTIPLPSAALGGLVLLAGLGFRRRLRQV